MGTSKVAKLPSVNSLCDTPARERSWSITSACQIQKLNPLDAMSNVTPSEIAKPIKKCSRWTLRLLEYLVSSIGSSNPLVQQ